MYVLTVATLTNKPKYQFIQKVMYTYISNKAGHVPVQVFMWLLWYQQQQQGMSLNYDLLII